MKPIKARHISYHEEGNESKEEDLGEVLIVQILVDKDDDSFAIFIDHEGNLGQDGIDNFTHCQLKCHKEEESE